MQKGEKMTRKEAIEVLKNAAFLATTTSYQSIEEAVKIAVTALEQPEPCEDAVSRQAVYTVIEEVLYETTKGADNWYGLLNDGVRTLLSVTPKPEPQWISVSERLPEEYKRVLVSDVFGVYVGELVDAEENWGGKHFIDAHGIHSISVKAWQPLPEPYKERREG